MIDGDTLYLSVGLNADVRAARACSAAALARLPAEAGKGA